MIAKECGGGTVRKNFLVLIILLSLVLLSFSPAYASFNIYFNTSGYVKDTKGNSLNDADVVLNVTEGSNSCYSSTLPTTRSTNSAGYWEMNNQNAHSGADWCMLGLDVKKSGYFNDYTEVNITYDQEVYQWNRTLSSKEPWVTTGNVTDISSSWANVNAKVHTGNQSSVELQIYYNNGTQYSDSVGTISSDGVYSHNITGLASDTQYDWYAKITYSGNEKTGQVKTFTTEKESPSITTQSATNVGLYEATLNSQFTTGDFSSVDVYFSYREKGTSGWTNTTSQSFSSGGSYAEDIDSLDPDTTYEFRGVLEYGNSNITTGSTLEFTTDEEKAPTYHSMNNDPSSPTNYEESKDYQFNITWKSEQDQVGQVIFHFDGKNYTPACNPGLPVNETDCTYTLDDLPASDYDYYWWAEDTRTLSNETPTLTYEVTEADPNLDMSVDPNWSITYGTQSNVSGINCPSQLSCVLYRNGVSVSNPDVLKLSVGSYDYEYNTSGNQNYTSDSVTNTLIVNEATPSLSLSVTNSTYPDNGVINASEANTGDSDLIYNLYIDGNFEASGSDIDISKDLGVGNYSVEYNTTGGTNYTSNSITKILEVEKAQGDVSLLLNNDTADLTVTYPQKVNASASTQYGSVTLYRNGTDVTQENDVPIELAAGYYNYTAISSGDQNHTSESITYFAEVDKATPDLDLYLNGSKSDLVITPPNRINITGESNLSDNQDLNFSLEVNGTEVDSGDPAVVESPLSSGYYEYSYTTTGGQNYTTGSSSTRYLTVRGVEVNITHPSNNSVTGSSTYLNATTNRNVTCRYGTSPNPVQNMNNTNDTSHSQFLTSLNGTETYYVNCTDDYNNTDEESVTWNADIVSPNVSLISPSNSTWESTPTDFIFKVTNGHSTQFTCSLMLNGTVEKTVSGVANNTETNITYSPSDGLWNWTVNCTDQGGNEDTATPREVMIDGTAPNVTIHSPSANQEINTGSSFFVNATAIDGGIGFNKTNTCSVYLDDSNVGTLNFTNGSCSGTLTFPSVSEGNYDLFVYVNDSLSNTGNDSVLVEAVSPPGGGGGGGGGGGFITPPEEENETEVNYTASITLDSNSRLSIEGDERESLVLEVENVGTSPLASIGLSVEELPDSAYVAPKTFKLDPNETKFKQITFIGEELDHGNTTVTITAANPSVSASRIVTLEVTSTEYLNATQVCDDADNYITNLSGEGVNVTGLNNLLDSARLDISEGDFENATTTCQSILAFTPEGEGGAPGGIGPAITGAFIGAGNTVIENAGWTAFILSLLVIGVIFRRSIFRKARWSIAWLKYKYRLRKI